MAASSLTYIVSMGGSCSDQKQAGSWSIFTTTPSYPLWKRIGSRCALPPHFSHPLSGVLGFISIIRFLS